MPANREFSSKVDITLVGQAAISANQAATAFGAVIDTTLFHKGTAFYVGATAYTDGDFTLTVQTADDAAFTQNVEDLTAEHYVEAPGLDGMTVGAELVAGTTEMTKVGVFATRKFIRLMVAAANVSSGATLLALAARSGDINPTGVHAT